jgi:hypothetical protein
MVRIMSWDPLLIIPYAFHIRNLPGHTLRKRARDMLVNQPGQQIVQVISVLATTSFRHQLTKPVSSEVLSRVRIQKLGPQESMEMRAASILQ